MKVSRNTLRAFWLAIALHIAVGALLVVSMDFPREIAVQPHAKVNVLEAVTVDSARVDEELDKLKEQERQKQEEQRRREEEIARQKAEAEKRAAEAEEKRKAEEKRLAELEQKRKEEQKAREAEEKRLAEIKKKQEEAERQRRLEEEKKRKAAEEAERLRKEAEAEKKRAEEERQRKIEEEKKRKAAEEAMRKQLAEEEARRKAAEAAAQARRDASVINEYGARIKYAIQQEFNTTGLPPGLSCVLTIRMVPGGEVVSVKVVESSGSAIFDRRAEVAVSRASPLPVPDDPRVFEQMREIRLTFEP
jgi:colicin import membrane protein